MLGYPSVVAGLDPAIQPFRSSAVYFVPDGRVKPGHDSGGVR
jgi:hypothetical protein